MRFSPVTNRNLVVNAPASVCGRSYSWRWAFGARRDDNLSRCGLSQRVGTHGATRPGKLSTSNDTDAGTNLFALAGEYRLVETTIALDLGFGATHVVLGAEASLTVGSLKLVALGQWRAFLADTGRKERSGGARPMGASS
jgi:hypothetical protein